MTWEPCHHGKARILSHPTKEEVMHLSQEAVKPVVICKWDGICTEAIHLHGCCFAWTGSSLEAETVPSSSLCWGHRAGHRASTHSQVVSVMTCTSLSEFK